MSARGLVVSVIAFACGHPALAADIAGASDHSLISRYPGSEITGYRHIAFDEYKIAGGVKSKNAFDMQTKSGKVTSIIYEVRGDQSALQVFRNYEEAVRKAGLNVAFSCVGPECGDGLPIALYRGSSREGLYRRMYYDSIHTGTADFGYMSATGTSNDAPLAIGVFVAHMRKGNRTFAGLDIIEGEPMKSGLIVVDVSRLQKDIQEHGRVVLEGIYFDTDKDVVKPESDQALRAIADYLRPSQQTFLVVGHSDAAGTYEHNVDLSRRRAQAVADALASKYSIAKSRLTAVGIGPAAPASSNANESGRARNRRVELVLLR